MKNTELPNTPDIDGHPEDFEVLGLTRDGYVIAYSREGGRYNTGFSPKDFLDAEKTWLLNRKEAARIGINDYGAYRRQYMRNVAEVAREYMPQYFNGP